MSIFREYDIRGIVPEELNRDSVRKIGYLLSKRISGRYVSVGYDARSHSQELFEYLSSGLNAGGKSVLNLGLVPTPISYFSNYVEFDGIAVSGSIMITGSHNPKEYNGFKITIDKMPFFADDIYRLGSECEALDRVEVVERDVVDVDVKTPYIDYMVDHFAHLKGLNKRIVYDCGNGVAGVVLPEIFKRLELQCDGLFVEPDGEFPNHHPDPSVEKNLSDVKEALGANGDIAFAYDGDGDRLAVLTHDRNIKGDEMAILFALKMDKPTVIGEVKCSQIMYDTLRKRGATAVMYKTGHSNLKVKIKELDADLACEVSGHIFFKDRYFGYDDAIYATLRVLELILDNIDLDKELDKLPKLFSTDEIKIATTESEKFGIVERLKVLLQEPPTGFPQIVEIIDIDGVRVVFEDGWGLVRASNTTPVLVTRFEATSEKMLCVYRAALSDLVASCK